VRAKPESQMKLRTTINRKWTIKMVVIGIVLIGFGIWGLLDAAWIYPRRGYVASSWLEFQYLDLFSREKPPLDGRAGVADPAAEFERLTRTKAERGSLDPVDAALLEWLDQLQVVGKLDGPLATAIPRSDFRGEEVTDARSRLELLTKQWNEGGEKKQTPSKLSFWDIPVQWLIMVAGLALGVYMFLLILRVRSKSYAWEPDAMQLTLPGGATLVPGDLEDVDKRRWHKFFVTLKVKMGHPQLGGRGVELDLLRYEPLEAWVLEMEKAAFPDRIEEAEEAADEAEVKPEAKAAPVETPPSMIETQKE
jgi:hypothetical protein